MNKIFFRIFSPNHISKEKLLFEIMGRLSENRYWLKENLASQCFIHKVICVATLFLFGSNQTDPKFSRKIRLIINHTFLKNYNWNSSKSVFNLTWEYYWPFLQNSFPSKFRSHFEAIWLIFSIWLSNIEDKR